MQRHAGANPPKATRLTAVDRKDVLVADAVEDAVVVIRLRYRNGDGHHGKHQDNSRAACTGWESRTSRYSLTLTPDPGRRRTRFSTVNPSIVRSSDSLVLQ